jgi:hypothetical protein
MPTTTSPLTTPRSGFVQPLLKVKGWEERERLRKAAEQANAARLFRIDELADFFAEIQGTARSTDVFNEMTRILRGQGLDQALAYAATQRAGILEKVEARLGPPWVGIDSVNFTHYNFDIPGILEDVPNRLSDISRRKSPSRLDTAAAGIGDALYDRLALHVTLFL